MNHFIDTILETALWFAVDWSLRWAALLIVVAFLLWIFRPRRATIRELVLKAALLAGLLIPFSPRWGGGWPWNHAPEPSALHSQSAAPSQSLSHFSSSSLPSSAWERTSGSSASRPVQEPDANQRFTRMRSEAEYGEEVQSECLDSRRLSVLGLVSCWSLAVAWLLARRTGGWLLLRRLRHESIEISGVAAQLFATCLTEMGVRRAVRLAANPHVRSPILVGWRQPQILVPVDWPQWGLESQRAALLHELAHVRRGDHLLNPLLESIRIVFSFHPLVRWLLARLEHEREWLCDEMVVRLGIDRRTYARLLLEHAGSSGRLAWSAISLPMSRRRTVKGRIYHLLEEDMERWIRPLSARWAVIFGACALAVSLGLASYRVWGEETEKPAPPANKAEQQPAPKKPAEPAIKREDLRYGDKDFYQWRRELLTELKPSIRADGMKAFAAFGVNGYGTEATQAILELMRSYDPVLLNGGDEDGLVMKAAYTAIQRIGAASVPALAAAVKEENRNVRLFAISALADLRNTAQPALPALLQAFKSGDLQTRESVIDAVSYVGQGNKEVAAALMGELNDPNAVIRTAAIGSLGSLGMLGMLGESAKPVVPAILKALSDTDAGVRIAAINALRALVVDAKTVAAISLLVQDKEKLVRDSAFQFLTQLTNTKEAKEAVPALIAALKNPDLDVRVIDVLERIGPAAKDAVPALRELLGSEDPVVNNRARNALRAIIPPDKKR